MEVSPPEIRVHISASGDGTGVKTVFEMDKFRSDLTPRLKSAQARCTVLQRALREATTGVLQVRLLSLSLSLRVPLKVPLPECLLCLCV